MDNKVKRNTNGKYLAPKCKKYHEHSFKCRVLEPITRETVLVLWG